MSENILRPAHIAAAAVTIGGALAILLPQHGMSLVRLVIVTVAAAAGLYALTIQAPPAWWMSPFDRRHRRGRHGAGRDDVDWIRSTLAGRRQPIDGGPPLPPQALALLQPLIRTALDREGIDPGDGTAVDSTGTRLAPITIAVLAARPLTHPSRRRTLRPDERQTASAVDAVLDDLERLAAGGTGPPAPIDNPGPRAT